MMNEKAKGIDGDGGRSIIACGVADRVVDSSGIAAASCCSLRPACRCRSARRVDSFG